MLARPIALAILLIFSLTHLSQAVPLRGIVQDEQGEALPFVSIYVENSTYGVASNSKGEYLIELTPGKHRLVFRSLGFTTQVVDITMGTAPQRKNVVLISTEVELSGVTILASGRDPAYAIIESAMEVRKKHLEALEGYTRTTYIKATSESVPTALLKIDTTGRDSARGKLNFVEAIGTTHFQWPNRLKEIKTGYRDLSSQSQITTALDFSLDGNGIQQTGYMNPYLFYINASDANFNFYQNLLNIPSLGDLPYQSPIGAGAMISYRYYLEETFEEKGITLHKILVEPRNKEGALFKGHIFIQEGNWAIRAVDLEINPGGLRFFRYFKVIQQYEEMASQVYVPLREEFYYNARDGRKLVMSNTIALHSEYEINPEFPPRFFGNELRRIEKEAMERDASFWQEIRPISLKAEEQAFVNEQDSLNAYYNSDEYLDHQDSIYNAISITKVVLTGFGHRYRNSGWSWWLDGLYGGFQPFLPGGYHHEVTGRVTKNFSTGYRATVNGTLTYGFLNQDVTGKVQGRYLYLPRKQGEWYAGVGETYALLNTLAAAENLFFFNNYILQTFVEVGHKMEFFNGFFADINLQFQNQKPITDLMHPEWYSEALGETYFPQVFDPYEQLLLETTISYTPGMKYYIQSTRKVNVGSVFPTFQLRYRKGIPQVLGSEIDFDMLELSIDHHLDLKYFGTLKYKAFAGRFVNDRSVWFIEHKWFQGSYPLIMYRPLSSAQHLGASLNTKLGWFNAHAAHHFDGYLMNKIPLLNLLGLQTTVGGSLILLQENNFAHSEIFFGVDKPFNIFKQRVSLGLYGVISTSTTNPFQSSIQVAGNFFNPFTQRWAW